jgi:hypothetical protein
MTNDPHDRLKEITINDVIMNHSKINVPQLPAVQLFLLKNPNHKIQTYYGCNTFSAKNIETHCGKLTVVFKQC